MATWALVVFFHVGALGSGDSNSTTVVHGFTSEALCESALPRVKKLAAGVKSSKAVCVRTN